MINYAQQQKQQVQLRLQQDQELRAALLDLPYEKSIAAGLTDGLAGKELWLLQMNSEDLANKANGKSDMSLLQFAFSNIAQELVNGAGLEAQLLLVEHDSFVLITAQHGVEESFARSHSKCFLRVFENSLSI